MAEEEEDVVENFACCCPCGGVQKWGILGISHMIKRRGSGGNSPYRNNCGIELDFWDFGGFFHPLCQR